MVGIENYEPHAMLISDGRKLHCPPPMYVIPFQPSSRSEELRILGCSCASQRGDTRNSKEKTGTCREARGGKNRALAAKNRKMERQNPKPTPLEAHVCPISFAM